MNVTQTNLISVASVLALLAPSGPSVAADSAAEFYNGRTVIVQVPVGSGGTYHVYCQVVARHIGKHLPGDPKVVVQNMPGAGGAKSASYMANAAPKDGSIIAMIAPGTNTAPLIRDQRFDVREFNWLGSVAARGNGIAVWHTVPIRTLEDLKKTEVKLGATGRSAAGAVFPLLTNAVLGTKIDIITGYKSGGAINLAIERGEVEGRWNFYSGFTGVRPEWIKENKIRFLIQYGPRNPALKGVPHMEDLLKPGTEDRRMYDVMALDLNVGQGFYAPPGLPADRVAALKKAFADMIADPATRKEVEERRIEWSPKSADEVQAEIAKGFKAATPEVVARLKEVLLPKDPS